jgi:hypothetical protein
MVSGQLARLGEIRIDQEVQLDLDLATLPGVTDDKRYAAVVVQLGRT